MSNVEQEIGDKTARIIEQLVSIELEGREWTWEDREDDDASFYIMKQELLLAYCTNYTYYLYLKASGQSVRDHPVMDRLYEMRLVFEKMKMVESKLRHLLDKVLAENHADEEQITLRPQPWTMNTISPEKNASGIYQPPRLTAVSYEKNDDDDDDDDESVNFGLKLRTTRARRNEMMRVVREQDDLLPERASSTGATTDSLGTGTKAARRERLAKEERERTKFEESRFIRIDPNKKQKKKRKMAANPFSNSLDDLI